MAFLLIGLLLVALKLAAVGIFAACPWWAVLLPFGLAVLWWSWADGSGWTKRRAMDRFEAKRRERRERNMANLGMKSGRRRRR